MHTTISSKDFSLTSNLLGPLLLRELFSKTVPINMNWITTQLNKVYMLKVIYLAIPSGFKHINMAEGNCIFLQFMVLIFVPKYVLWSDYSSLAFM
jgi:hypothetical protein